jgi:hypothetical protein
MAEQTLRKASFLTRGLRPRTPGILSLSRQNVRFTLETLERRIGLRRDATRAPTQRPEWRGGASRPKENSHSGGKAVNPRGLGTESPRGFIFIEGLRRQWPLLSASSGDRI